MTIREIPSSDTFFSRLKDLQAASKKLPSWLTNKGSDQFKFMPPKHRGLIDRLCRQVADSLPTSPASKPVEDPRLSAAIPLILEACYHHKKTMSLLAPLTEADLRVGIDSLLSHIYDSGEAEMPVEYCTERPLKLPRGSSGIDVATTTADGVGVLVLPEFDAYEMNDELMKAAAAYGKEDHAQLIIIHCVVEYKTTENGANQAMMGLVSGLYQKKALHMTHQFVFGVFQYATNSFQVVAAAWRGGNIQVYKVGKYSLVSPMHAVQLYLILRGIKDLADEYHLEYKQSESSLFKTVKADPPKNEWVLQSIPTIPEDSEEFEDWGRSVEWGDQGQGKVLGLLRTIKPELTTAAELFDGLAVLGELDGYDRTCEFVQRVRFT
ncbi:hypothetical protein FRC11_007178 [Ceratobasidium sp. 423]|nr:hypothetical protein FRC11_007178 [Ceratobasidium sp. 423]